MNAKEAAERLGVHYQTVRNWIQSGEIEATKRADATWAIAASEVERVLRKQVDALWRRLEDLEDLVDRPPPIEEEA